MCGLDPLFLAFGCFTIKVYSFDEMPKYIVQLFMYFDFVFAHICLGRRTSSNDVLERVGRAKVKWQLPLAIRRSDRRKTCMFQSPGDVGT